MDARALERRWRLAWMRAIAGRLPGPETVAASWSAREAKTLFVRYERIGDMIMATGLIRVLANASTRGQIDVLANPSTAPVLANNPHVRTVFELDRKSVRSYVRVTREVRRERYDVIVDGRINNPAVFTSTPLVMLAAGAPYRIGVGGGNNDLIYNVRVRAYDRSTPYIEGSKELARPFGVDPADVDWQPEIILVPAEIAAAEGHWRGGTRRLLVNLSASEPKRRWQDEKFMDVLQRVVTDEPGLTVRVIGLPAEWDSVRAVASAIRSVGVPTPRLRDALAMVATSSYVFTPDTSISHAASAFRKPAVVLLKRDHHPYAPYNIPAELVFWDGSRIHSLEAEEVLRAVRRMLRR